MGLRTCRSVRGVYAHLRLSVSRRDGAELDVGRREPWLRFGSVSRVGRGLYWFDRLFDTVAPLNEAQRRLSFRMVHHLGRFLEHDRPSSPLFGPGTVINPPILVCSSSLRATVTSRVRPPKQTIASFGVRSGFESTHSFTISRRDALIAPLHGTLRRGSGQIASGDVPKRKPGWDKLLEPLA